MNVLEGEGQPLRPKDLEFMQNATAEVFKETILGLGGQRCIINGLEVSVEVNVVVSAGYFFDGEEVCKVESANFAMDAQKRLFLVRSATTGESRIFEDTSEHDVWEYRKYAVGYATEANIPVGAIVFSPLKKLLDLITDHVLALVPGGGGQSGIAILEKKVLFESANLDQAQQLIPAPGEKKYIKVLGAVAYNKVNNQLAVQGQQLFMAFGTDCTTAGIGRWPTRFLEYPNTVANDMIPVPDIIYPNQPVCVGLSLETPPSAGSSQITIYIIYKIVEF